MIEIFIKFYIILLTMDFKIVYNFINDKFSFIL